MPVCILVCVQQKLYVLSSSRIKSQICRKFMLRCNFTVQILMHSFQHVMLLFYFFFLLLLFFIFLKDTFQLLLVVIVLHTIRNNTDSVKVCIIQTGKLMSCFLFNLCDRQILISIVWKIEFSKFKVKLSLYSKKKLLLPPLSLKMGS